MRHQNAVTSPFRIESLTARELSVPLRDPFVIASARMDATRSVLVTARLASGEIGIGEAAALYPVTREDQPDVMTSVATAAQALIGREFARVDDIDLAVGPVARAGIETALLDALARKNQVAVRTMIGGALGDSSTTLVTDITIPILDVARMVELAREWRAHGFRCFKVKVGKDRDHDIRALCAIFAAVPDAKFRIDANAAFTAKDAIGLAHDVARAGLVVECYEQPCAAEDIDAMAEVAHALDVPIVADESVTTLADLQRVLACRAADGVNLKLAKSGGILAALAIGRAARDAGMSIMVGGMLETRLGMTAAAHVAAALGGVEFVDLDTAWLLDGDPFEGGYAANGPNYTLAGDGLGITLRAATDA